MKFYFDRKVLIGFIFTIIVLITLGIFSFSAIQRLINTTRLLTHGLSVISNGDLALKSVLELEAGERAYVISGDSTFLDPYKSAPRGINFYMHKLDSLTSRDSAQKARVDSLHNFIKTKRWLSDSISRAVRNRANAQIFIAGEEARKVSAGIRSVVRHLQVAEGENFRRQNTIQGNSLQQFQLSFVGLALACTLIILYLFYVINKTLKAKNEAQELLRTSAKARQSFLEAELAEADYLYRSLAANIPGSSITVLDRDERHLLAEGDLLDRMGYEKSTLPGKRLADVMAKENYTYYKSLIDRALKGEVILVERQTTKGIYALVKVVPLKKSDGEIFAIMFVLIDVTAMKEAQLQLEKVNNELESTVSLRTEQLTETNKQLEAFSYSVSHDLRAPLRAINGYSQIILEDYGPLLDDEGKRASMLVMSNAKRMGKLIDDLLDFSRMSRKEMSTSVVNVAGMVDFIVQEMLEENTSRNIDVQCGKLDPCIGDANMLQQAWINLLSNAFKYTGKVDRAVIAISSKKEGTMIRYCVKDNGAGFSMQYVEKLFGVFQRLHKATEFEGTGVGLALVKTIIVRHGGIIVANSAPGQGAEFEFTLPGVGEN